MYKMMVIAPYIGLQELINTCRHEYPAFSVDIQIGDLDNALPIAREAEAQGYDILVSRGGTAKLIQQHVSIPVVEIDVSGYDFLRVLRLAQTYSGQTAVVGFPNITQSAAVACDLMQLHMDMLTIQHQGEVDPLLQNLSAQGYQTFIGDVVTVRAARRMGFNAILLTSGKESVESAFTEAEKTLASIERYKSREQLLRRVMDTLPEIVLAVDEKGAIVYANQGGQDLDYQRWIIPYLPGALRSESTAVVEWEDEALMHISTTQQFVLGKKRIVFRLSRKPMPKGGLSGVSFKNSRHRTSLPFGYLGGMAYMRDVARKAQAYARTDRPILITGEYGTGKDTLAYAIHQDSACREYPFVTLDCELMDKTVWDALLDDAHSSLLEPQRCTIYLRNLYQIDTEAQKRLFLFIHHHPAAAKLRFVSSDIADISAQSNDQCFSRDLYSDLAALTIRLPPLQDRKAEIPNLVGHIINETNTRYGRQVISPDEMALQILMEYNWPGNIDQLQQVVEALVLSAQSHYIQEEDVREALQRHTVPTSRQLLLAHKTLEALTQDIISAVLEQEGGNQTAAATRLGISRSTLWRKLNEIETKR